MQCLMIKAVLGDSGQATFGYRIATACTSSTVLCFSLLSEKMRRYSSFFFLPEELCGLAGSGNEFRSR